MRRTLLSRLLLVIGVAAAAPSQATSFVSEVVDTVGNPGGGNSIVRDANGDLHVSYTNCDNGELRYAERISGVWSTRVLDSGVPGFQTNFFTSLALDGNGDPHIAYVHPWGATRAVLRHATRHAGVWSKETVDSLSFSLTALWPSLAIAPSGRPVIAYAYRGSIRTIRYAERAANGTWSIQTAFTDGPGYEVALALDSAGEPQIAFNYLSGTELHVVSRSSGVWTDVKVDSVTYYLTGEHTASLFDGSGDLHLVYQENTGDGNFDVEPRILKHAVRHAGVWSTELVDPNVGSLDPGEFYVQWNGLSLNNAGTLRASYCTGDYPWQTRMATLRPGGWVIEDVDTTNSSGFWNSIAAGGNEIAIAYDRTDYTVFPYSSELRVATGAADVGVSSGRPPVALGVTAYPNPARAGSAWRLRLALPRDERVSVELFDLSGRRVWSRPTELIPAGSRNLPLAPGSLASGLYLARVSAGASGTRTLRLALVR